MTTSRSAPVLAGLLVLATSARVRGDGPAAAKPGQPALQGLYRMEYVAKFDDEGKKVVEGTRHPIVDLVRDSVTSPDLVLEAVEQALDFRGNRVELHYAIVFRSKKTGKYSWASCVTQGPVEWKGASLTIPARISTDGEAGVVGGQQSDSVGCHVFLNAQTLRLKVEKSGALLIGPKDDGNIGFAVTKIERPLSPEKRARELAGGGK
jgi:hypothetical protein